MDLRQSSLATKISKVLFLYTATAQEFSISQQTQILIFQSLESLVFTNCISTSTSANQPASQSTFNARKRQRAPHACKGTKLGNSNYSISPNYLVSERDLCMQTCYTPLCVPRRFLGALRSLFIYVSQRNKVPFCIPFEYREKSQTAIEEVLLPYRN